MPARAFRVGTGATDTVADIKFIHARTTAANNYMTFEQPTGTDYQVPAGKTFYITRIKHMGEAASTGFYLGHGSAGVGDGVPAPAGETTISPITGCNPTAGNELIQDVFYSIAAGRFPFMKQTGAGPCDVSLYGFEL